MYDQNSAVSPVRQGTSSSSAIAPIPAGRLGSDLGGSANLFNPARHHERDLGVKPAHLTGTNFTADQAKLFIRYLEQLASTGLYNAAIVWVRNVDQKAFYVLSFRILETSVAERNKSRPWHQTWTLDLIIEAMREIYDPHRFDDSVEKWRAWVRETRKNLRVDYNDLEGLRTTYAGGGLRPHWSISKSPHPSIIRTS